MAKSDLLKEAIADAKAVKETALENAKIALQEAFAPRLERMLATELTNELEGDEEEMPVDDLADAPVGDEEGFGDEMPEDEEGGVEWIDNDISFSVGGQTFDATVDNPIEPIDGEEGGVEDGEGFGDEFPEEEADAFDAGVVAGEEEEDDLNLEAIIRELEGMDDDKIPTDGDELKMANEGMYAEEDADADPANESIDDIIEAILREEYDEEDEDEDEDEEEKEDEKDKELAEAYATVSELKNILSEVNLLNAKLLYTNKLFRNFELNDAQKMKVIENFDRAANTREAKLVFTTLAESFKRPTKKRVVKESAASRPVASTAPRKENTAILNEGFAQAERWKKLAGLL
jgi:hypothetical protein